jgi:hypothetical protein
VSAARLDHGRCDLRRDRALVDEGHVGEHDDPAVEGGHRDVQAQRLDQHPHAAQGPPAGQREEHPAFLQLVHCPDRARGEHLALRDEGAVHVRQDGGDRRPGSVGSVSHLVQLPLAPLADA